MVSDYRIQSTHNLILHSATLSEPLRFDRYIGQDLGRMQHQHLQSDEHGLSSHPHQPYPYPYPYPYSYPHTRLPFHSPQRPLDSARSHDHQAILREIEKERIRQDIIMSEIIRRHGLEAEVRRELMIDRERVLQRGGNGFLEKRVMAPLTQRDMLNNSYEGGGSESLPFQRAASSNARTATKVKPVLEGSNEKKKIILQAKPVDNITGAKRARSGTDANESPSDGNLKKKAKEEWSCALCQVSAGSERILKAHLEGKKHKKKEAALKSQKAGENSSNNLKKGESIVHHRLQKNDDKPKMTKKTFWCEICQIVEGSWKKRGKHEKGTQHKRLLQLSNHVSVVGPSDQMDGVATDEKVV